jgi:hypothetical protein
MIRSLVFLGLLALGIVGGCIQAIAASPSVVMAVTPITLGGQIIGRSGTIYTPNAAGQITVTSYGDVDAFVNAGFTIVPSGVTPTILTLVSGKNANGSVLVTTGASAGNFTAALTAGTSQALNGEAAQGNTKTDTVAFEFVLPATYVAGNSLTITVNASYSGSGTAGTKTVAAAAYLEAAAGTMGSTLVATSAQTITTSNAAYAFTVAGSTLAPGSRVLITVTTVMQETGGSASLTAQLTSVTAG